MPLIEETLRAGKTVKFSPKGVSMLPMLRQGIDSVILAAPTGKLKKYDLPLYRRRNGLFVLHRVVKAGERYTCIGDNQFQLERGISQEQIIGVMVAFTRGKKQYAADHPGYWLYCRFWHYSRPIRRLWRGGISRLRRLLK